MVPWAHLIQPPNGIWIGYPFLHSWFMCSTDTHTDHATCNVYSNRPHLCSICAMRPKNWEYYFSNPVTCQFPIFFRNPSTSCGVILLTDRWTRPHTDIPVIITLRSYFKEVAIHYLQKKNSDTIWCSIFTCAQKLTRWLA